MYDGSLKFDTAIDQGGFLNGIGDLESMAEHGMNSITKVISSAKDVLFSFGKDVLTTGSDFEAGMSQVAATLQYSVADLNDSTTQAYENMQKLSDKAEEMGAKTAFTASQAADALNILAQSGFDADQSIMIAPNSLDLASAGKLSLDSAAGYIAVAMKGFTNEMDHFADEAEASKYYADIIAKGATLASTSVDGLGRAFSMSAANANSYGQSAAETAVSLLRLADQGVTAEEAANNLKTIMSNMFSESTQAAEIYQTIGFSAYTEVDGVKVAKEMNAAFDELNQKILDYANGDEKIYADFTNAIFGLRGQAAFKKLVASSESQVQKFFDGLANAEGSAALQAETMLDNLSGRITIFKSAYDGLKNSIFKPLKNDLKDIVKTATDYLSELTEISKADGLAALAGALPDKAADFLPVLTDYLPDIENTGAAVLDSLADGLVRNMPVFSDAFLKIKLTMARLFAKGLANAGKVGASFLAQLAGSLQQNPGQLKDIVSGILHMFADSLRNDLPSVIRSGLKISEIFLDTLDSPEVSEAGREVLDSLGDAIVKSTPVLADKVPAVILKLVQFLKDNAVLIQEAAEPLLEKLGGALKDKAKEKIREKAPEIMQKIEDALKETPGTMAAVADVIISAVADSLGIGDKWQAVRDKIKENLNGLDFDALKMNLEIAVSDLPEDFRTNWETMTSSLSDSFDRVKGSWENLKSALKLDEKLETGEFGTDAGDAAGGAIAVIAGAVAVAADSVSKMISGTMDFAAWLSEGSTEAETFKTVVIGLSTAVAAFAGMVALNQTIPAMLTGLAKSISAFLVPIAAVASPVTIAVAALLGLIAVLAYLYNNSETWQAGWESIKEWYQGLIDAFARDFEKDEERWNDFWDSWKIGEKTLEEFGEKVYDFQQDLEERFKELIENAKQWGRDLVDGFVGGVKEKWNDWEHTWEGVGEALYDLLHGSGAQYAADQTVADLQSAYEINSPSKLMRDEVGQYLALGIGEGFTENMPDVGKDAKNAFDSIMHEIPKISFDASGITEKIDPGALQALHHQSIRMMSESPVQTNPVTQIINQKYYQNTVSQNTQNPETKPADINMTAYLEMDGQVFGTAVKKVILDENAGSGGMYL